MSLSSKAENIQVVVRCRPVSSEERIRGMTELVEADSVENEVRVHVNLGSKKGMKAFTFDRVYNQTYSQRAIYEETVRPLVMQTLKGFNTTVFAYGQTGTGKTFTMEGDQVTSPIPSDNRGMIPRAVDTIFQVLAERNELSDSFIKASFLEIYNESCSDLLSPDETPLRVLEDKIKGAVVQGLEEILVRSSADVDLLFRKALAKRKTAPTDMNEKSSRSHSIFTLTVHMKDVTMEGEEVMRVGKINLVDLAGSECVARSGSKNDRAREAGNINQSLLTLGRVITALVTSSPHVPYRDSKLTRLLQESLGGCALTCIIATVAPTAPSLDETVSTLEYASRAKSIKNKPVQNQKFTKRAMIKEYVEEMERMRSELAAARAKDGVYLPQDRYQELLASLQGTSTKATDLETQLERRAADLEQTQAILRETKTELARTQTDLACERQRSEERQVLLDAHVDTEARLHDVHDALHRAMETSEDITARLHKKLERKSHVEMDNVRTVSDHRDRVETALTQINALTTQQHAQNVESFNRLAEVATALSRCVEKDAPTSREIQREYLFNLATTKLNTVLDLFQQCSKSDDQREVEFSVDVSQALNRATSALADLVTMAKSMQSTLQETKGHEMKIRTTTLETLCQELDKCRFQSTTFLCNITDMLTQVTAEMDDMAIRMMQQQQVALKENETRLHTIRQDLMTQSCAVAHQVEISLKDIMVATQQAMNLTAKQTETSLAKLAQDSSMALNEAHAKSVTDITATHTKMTQNKSEIVAKITTMQTTIDQHGLLQENAHVGMMTAVKMREEEARRMAVTFNGEATRGFAELETMSMTEQAAAQQARYDAETMANGGSALRVERLDNMKTTIGMANDALKQAVHAGREEASKSDARAAGLLEESNRVAKMMKDNDKKFVAAHSENVGDVLTCEKKFVLAKDQSTGDTPHKNTKLDWPKHMRPATSPHHVILDRLRKGRFVEAGSGVRPLSDMTNHQPSTPPQTQTPLQQQRHEVVEGGTKAVVGRRQQHAARSVMLNQQG